MRHVALAIALGLASLLAQGAAAETIKIGTQKPVGGPLYIANDKGYYAAEGLTPEYVFFEAGEPIAVAVASGAVDFAVAGLTGGFYSLAGQGALKIIAGISLPYQGRLNYKGREVASINTDVGFVTQDSNLFPWLTLIENVELALKIRGVSKEQRAQTAAEDLVQETYLRAVSAFGQLVPNSNLKSWLFVIMRNAWLDIQKSRGIRRTHADTILAMTQTESGGEDAAIASLTLRAVREALQSLPEDQRVVVTLVCIDDFSYAQAAEALGVPVGTIMSRLSRGRATLRHLVNGAPRRETCIEPAIGAAR